MGSLKKLHKKISLLSYQHLDQPQSDSSIENSPYNFVILLQSFTSHSCCYKAGKLSIMQSTAAERKI